MYDLSGNVVGENENNRMVKSRRTSGELGLGVFEDAHSKGEAD